MGSAGTGARCACVHLPSSGTHPGFLSDLAGALPSLSLLSKSVCLHFLPHPLAPVLVLGLVGCEALDLLLSLSEAVSSV